MNKFGIIITTIGDSVGIRHITAKEKDRFIQWMEDDKAYPMFSTESTWSGKTSKKFIVKRMVCAFEIVSE
jgi:hypothetical protein